MVKPLTAPAPPVTGTAARPPSLWRRFHGRVTCLALAAVAALLSTNVFLDPYGVFGSPLLADGAQLNERVVKHRHILKMTAAPEVLLMGSSVMGVVPPNAIAPGRSSFNLSFFSATPTDIRKMLDALERANRLPRAVVIGVDPFMLSSPNLTSPQMHLPPAATGAKPAAFWKDYLLAGSASAAFHKVVDHFVGTPGVAFDRLSGTYTLASYDAQIVRDHEAFMKRRFGAPSWSSKRPPLEPGLQEMRELLAWTRSRPTLDVVWVLPPIHRAMREALGGWGDSYRQQVTMLLGPGVVDLTDEPVANDNRLWYEPKHFRAAAVPAFAEPIANALNNFDRLAAR